VENTNELHTPFSIKPVSQVPIHFRWHNFKHSALICESTKQTATTYI